MTLNSHLKVGQFSFTLMFSLLCEINLKMEDGKELQREQVLFNQDVAAFYFSLRCYKIVLINCVSPPTPLIRFYFKTSICSILIICFQNPGMIPNVSYGNIMLVIKKRKIQSLGTESLKYTAWKKIFLIAFADSVPFPLETQTALITLM